MEPLLRRVPVFVSVVALVWLAAAVAWGGSPHFISCSATINGNVLSVDGKEAGLGDEATVDIEVTATALCINNGGNHPKAVNKTGVAANGQFPVSNGKALFSLDATATFQPDCEPPMTVEFQDISVCDTGNGVCCTL